MKSGFLSAVKTVIVVSLLSVVPLAAGQGPVPFVNLPLSPGAVTPGSAGFTLTVNGTGFVTGAVVSWNGSARASTFVSASQITAAILASDVATPGIALVTVSNPKTGSASNLALFDVTTPVTALGFTQIDVQAGAGSSAIVAADFDGDGNMDLAVANQTAGTVSVLLGNGNATFQTHVDYAVGSAPIALVVSDVNGDGYLDLLCVNSGSNSISVLLGNGNGTFQLAKTYGTGNSPQWLAAADLNGDGSLDLVTANSTGNSVSVLLGKGDGSFPTHTETSIPGGPSSVAIGDFNHDGYLDLAVSSTNANSVSLLMGDGKGNFTSGTALTGIKAAPHSVAVGDFDGDGNLDLAIANEGSNGTLIAFGKGDGTFVLPLSVYSTGATPSMELAGDLNGDGRLDLITNNLSSQSTFSYLLYLENRNFQFHINYATGSTPLGLTVGDFNNDGKLDIAVAASGTGSAAIMLQQPAVSVAPASITFHNQALGTASAAEKVVFTNNTSTTITISSIASTGDFADTGACKVIGAGTTCTVTVTFTPTATGTRTGTLTFSGTTTVFTATPVTVVVNLSGVGVLQATLSPVNANFGSVAVGKTSAPKTFTLVNNLNTALSISSMATSSEFAYVSHCGTTVPAKSKCETNVTFTPSATGAQKGTLSVTDSATDSPQVSNLTGNGTK
jgi:hypothetical protein